jgi:fibronectin type 3 domain-containing protein
MKRGLQHAAALVVLGCVLLSLRTRPALEPTKVVRPAPIAAAPEPIPAPAPEVVSAPVRYQGLNYSSTATDDGGVTATLPTGETLRLALDRIRVGNRILATGGAAAPRRDGGDGFSYDRGTVEERYRMRTGEFEQDFVLRELPEGRGEIIVEEILTTEAAPPLENIPSPSLEFRARPDASFVISRAVAIDAADRRLPLDLVYAKGRMRMTVPEAWVREATLPIVVDPLVGGMIVLASPVGWQNGAQMNVACGGNPKEYIAVYYDGFNTAWNVYSRRVSAAGVVLGGGSVTGGVSGVNYEPAIAYSSFLNKYLVVWVESIASQSIYLAGRFLDSVGTPSGPEFRVGTYTGSITTPAVAADASGNFLAVVQVGTSIHGAIVDSTGAVPLTGRPAIQNASTTAQSPRVAFSNGVYLVAWNEAAGTMAAKVNTSGGLITTSPALVAGSSSLGGLSNGNSQFLITWSNAASPYTLMGRVLQANASTSISYATTAFSIADNTFAGAPAWSPTSNVWLTATQPGTAEIVGRTISPVGGVSAPIAPVLAVNPSRNPKVAWNSDTNDVLVVFQRDATPANMNFSIAAQRYNIGAVLVPPGAPTNLQATGGDTIVNLTWTAPAGGAASYKVFQATTSGGYGPTPIVTTTSTTFTATGLVNGQTYYYVVRASNASGDGAASNEAWAVPLPPPPPAPTGLTGTVGDGRVSLSWAAVAGATNYVVKRALSSTGPWEDVGTPTGTSLTVTGLVNGVLYWFAVAAENLGGEGPISTPISRTPAAPTIPVLLVVGNATLVAGDSALQSRLQNMGFSVTVKAAAASLTTDANGKKLVVISSTVTSTDVAAKFRDVAVPVINHEPSIMDDMGMTGTTTADFGTVASQDRISMVAANASHMMAAGKTGIVQVTSSLSTFTWGRPNANAVSIAVVNGDTTNPRSVIFGYDTGAAMVVGTAARRRVGFFVNDATASVWNANGVALFEAAVRWATFSSSAPAAPSTVSTTFSNGQVVISWSQVSNATSYNVYRSTSSSGPFTLIARGVTGNSYTNLVANGTYYFRIVAVNASGMGAPAAPVLATPNAGVSVEVGILGPKYIRRIPPAPAVKDDYCTGQYQAIVCTLNALGARTPLTRPLDFQDPPASTWLDTVGGSLTVIDAAQSNLLIRQLNAAGQGTGNITTRVVLKAKTPTDAFPGDIKFDHVVGKKRAVNAILRFPENSPGRTKRKVIDPQTNQPLDLFADDDPMDNPVEAKRAKARNLLATKIQEDVNRVWKQDCIEFYVTADVRMGNLTIAGFVGNEFISGTANTGSSKAFQDLEKKNLVGTVNIYLVEVVKDGGNVIGGATLSPMTASPARLTIVLSDADDGVVGAHELGHSLGLDDNENLPANAKITGRLNNLTAPLGESAAIPYLLMLSKGRTAGQGWLQEFEAKTARDNAAQGVCPAWRFDEQ